MSRQGKVKDGTYPRKFGAGPCPKASRCPRAGQCPRAGLEKARADEAPQPPDPGAAVLPD
jgi:hypothetical protein